jgi:hypothetical protein
VGIVGRAVESDGKVAGPLVVLAANTPWPALLESKEITSHKQPTALFDRAGHLWVFWTEERAVMRVDFFRYSLKVLERDVVGRVFDANGAPLVAKFRAHEQVAGWQQQPAARRYVAAGVERVAVAWATDARAANAGVTGVYLRVFDAAGAALGSDVVVSNRALGQKPALAWSAADGLLVGWTSWGDGDGTGIFTRRFNAAGTALSNQRRINEQTALQQWDVALTTLADGGFFAAWTTMSGNPLQLRVRGRALGSDGAPAGAEFAVSQGVGVHESHAALLPGASGPRVAWMRWNSGLPVAVVLAGIDVAARGLAGPEQDVSETRPGAGRIALAALPESGLLAAWVGANGHNKPFGIHASNF